MYRRDRWRRLDDRHESIDARDDDWARLLTDIDDLLTDNSYVWARPTLQGIRTTVETQARCTPAQRRAVDQIRRGLYPTVRRRWTREP